MQNHERPTQPIIFSDTLYFWFMKRNCLDVLTALGFAKLSVWSNVNLLIFYPLGHIRKFLLHSPSSRGTEHTLSPQQIILASFQQWV